MGDVHDINERPKKKLICKSALEENELLAFAVCEYYKKCNHYAITGIGMALALTEYDKETVLEITDILDLLAFRLDGMVNVKGSLPWVST